MPILHLILGHLIGDFLLQPDHLLHWKKRHITGALVHVLIHMMVYLLILFPYVQNNWTLLIILGIGVAHLIIDQVKVVGERTKKKYRLYFIVDQVAHLVTLAIAGLLIMYLDIATPQTYLFGKIYLNPFLSLLFSLGIFKYRVLPMYKVQKHRKS
ncbi:MAG: DUF3307 domain-containing protein [Patescibacteria group bacterium]|nr:DUF3307 domain-containing protein [Patescibacteria group bacterium]